MLCQFSFRQLTAVFSYCGRLLRLIAEFRSWLFSLVRSFGLLVSACSSSSNLFLEFFGYGLFWFLLVCYLCASLRFWSTLLLWLLPGGLCFSASLFIVFLPADNFNYLFKSFGISFLITMVIYILYNQLIELFSIN